MLVLLDGHANGFDERLCAARVMCELRFNQAAAGTPGFPPAILGWSDAMSGMGCPVWKVSGCYRHGSGGSRLTGIGRVAQDISREP